MLANVVGQRQLRAYAAVKSLSPLDTSEITKFSFSLTRRLVLSENASYLMSAPEYQSVLLCTFDSRDAMQAILQLACQLTDQLNIFPTRISAVSGPQCLTGVVSTQSETEDQNQSGLQPTTVNVQGGPASLQGFDIKFRNARVQTAL